MKRTHPIRTLLGFKQDEMALLFGVSRAHWSMYEIGKRDLPLSASLLMAEIVSHLKPAEKKARHTHQSPIEHLEKQKAKLEWALQQNFYLQRIIPKKITDTEKKQAARDALVQLAKLHETKKEHTGKKEQLVRELIHYKAAQALKADHETELMQLEIKLEMLQLEKLVLDAKLRKILLSLENKDNEATR